MAATQAGRVAAAIVLLGSVVVLGSALLFQYVGGLQPCILCLYQRYPYWITIPLGLLALGARGRMRAALLGAAGATFLVGAGIAVYHVGVEQGLWQGPTICAGAAGAGTVDDLLAQLQTAPIVRCSDVAWSLFGVSMAGYNFLASLVLGAVALTAAGRLWRRRT